jgi:hypothetical protein
MYHKTIYIVSKVTIFFDSFKILQKSDFFLHTLYKLQQWYVFVCLFLS